MPRFSASFTSRCRRNERWYYHAFNMADDDLEPRDFVYALGVDFDIDAQLIAIRGLLQRNRDADESLQGEIKRIQDHANRLKGEAGEWAVDDWVDAIHHSAYQEAAHSMAAVGMLAPLVETIFCQCFQGIGRHLYPSSHPPKTHDRWDSAHRIQWDCHLVVTHGRVRKDIVQGILELSDAIGITTQLPSDLKKVLSALFVYRNRMFHHGFEWPIEKRDSFAKHIQNNEWPNDWFSIATTGDKPWIFVLSDNYIQHCIKTIEKVLQTIGDFVRNKMIRSID
jgi:hypothetical protein